jgi:redox-sensitive bicupin YhaK (pirin superfamily)
MTTKTVIAEGKPPAFTYELNGLSEKATSLTRRISRTVTTPPPAPGFIGRGHTVVEVVTSERLGDSDPFVLLMDDRLDIPTRRQIGGAHPHAGLETVTLILEGSLFDRDEGEMRAGDAVWMTAGRGIIQQRSRRDGWTVPDLATMADAAET